MGPVQAASSRWWSGFLKQVAASPPGAQPVPRLCVSTAAGGRTGDLPQLELDPALFRRDAASSPHGEPPRPSLLLHRPDHVDRTPGLLLLWPRSRPPDARLRALPRSCLLLFA